MMLSNVVNVSPRFQRSIRVDYDLASTGSLTGFIFNGTSKTTIENMISLMLNNKQRAFTWTGPYGGGKSSLALALCSAIGRASDNRNYAKDLFDSIPRFDQAFPTNVDGWLVIPVVGRRGNPVTDIYKAITQATKTVNDIPKDHRQNTSDFQREVISRLQSEAAIRPESGVLILLDEMGKYLESAAGEGVDIHFFQDLAEVATRSKGRLVVIGILHQSFDQYAGRLGRDIQNEWAKVQGRYVDIPIITAADEIIDLVGRAVIADFKHPTSLPVAKAIASSIRRRRPGSPKDLAHRLDACWPLHPVTAALLGPVSRRRFGQNERSIFGFLGSNEPEGFQDFLHSTTVSDGKIYNPDRLWDYLKINLEPAILSSPDGHRWAQGAEAVERSEGKGSSLHIRVAKTIALIDLFRNGSGIYPDNVVLNACFSDEPSELIDKALSDLNSWSVIVYRKHLESWAIFAGSDFDITAAVEQVLTSTSNLDLDRLTRIADLQPLLAKEHYHLTGSLRWFETALIGLYDVEQAAKSFTPVNGSSGLFLLAIPTEEETEETSMGICQRASCYAGKYPVAIGIPKNSWIIQEHGRELFALESIRAGRPELEGDQVARREIDARIAVISAQLEEELRTSFNEATWFVRGVAHERRSTRSMAKLVSQLAEITFPQAPVIHSELVNREKPSSNIQGAVRQLLYAMINHPEEEHLGIDGFPAERGLCSTILEPAGLHGKIGDKYGFKAPDGRCLTGNSFKAMWEAAEDLLKNTNGLIELTSLYKLWAEPPFGVRKGVLPIISMAFILAHDSSIAVYAEGMFQPTLNDYFIDRLLQDERKIAIRFVDNRADNDALMKLVSASLKEITGKSPMPKPLPLARALVEFVYNLPNWTRRTSSLSKEAQNVRRILLNASDPYKTLFVDLPHAVDSLPDQDVAKKITASLHELNNAYSIMLYDLKDRMLSALGHHEKYFDLLNDRAKTISGISGDLRLEAFTTRIAKFRNSIEDIESIAALAIQKPVHEWTDMDPTRVALEIADIALKFRQTELLTRVQGRMPTQHAIGIVFGTGEIGCTEMINFNVAEADIKTAQFHANQLLDSLKNIGFCKELILATLVEAGLQVISDAKIKNSGEQSR